MNEGYCWKSRRVLFHDEEKVLNVNISVVLTDSATMSVFVVGDWGTLGLKYSTLFKNGTEVQVDVQREGFCLPGGGELMTTCLRLLKIKLVPQTFTGN